MIREEDSKHLFNGERYHTVGNVLQQSLSVHTLHYLAKKAGCGGDLAQSFRALVAVPETLGFNSQYEIMLWERQSHTKIECTVDRKSSSAWREQLELPSLTGVSSNTCFLDGPRHRVSPVIIEGILILS